MNIEDVESNEKDVKNPMQKIFDKQLELVDKYKEIEKLPDWPLNLDLYEHQKIIKDFKQRGMEEVAEAIEAFRFEHAEHFKEELIDGLHFFVELNIQADDNNSSDIRVGAFTVTTTRGPKISKGNSIGLEGPSGPNGQAEEFVISDIFIVGTSGDVVELSGWRKR